MTHDHQEGIKRDLKPILRAGSGLVLALIGLFIGFQWFASLKVGQIVSRGFQILTDTHPSEGSQPKNVSTPNDASAQTQVHISQ